MQLLTEKFDALLESPKYMSLNQSGKIAMALMLENAEAEYNKLMAESATTADIAQFTPILMPLVRRVYPGLIANEILGVQPMTMPSGFMYSLVNRYTGDGQAASQINTAAGEYGVVLQLNKDVAAGTVLTGATSAASGVVLYVENHKVLVKVTSGTFGIETVNYPTAQTATVSGIFTNEASFKLIFKNYTGPVTTAAGEILAKDMKEVGFNIEKKLIEAKTRKLKGQYTLEMYQDLKAQHGLLADEELMGLMSAEMQNEMDREIVNFVNTNATQVSNAFAFTASSTDGSGRWEIEKYRVQAIKLANEARQIGIDTKRGQGNVVVCSPKFATMLEQLGGFTASPVAGNVSQPLAGGVAGTFDGKYKVIVDQYATSDYATVLYKGTDRRDGMGVFAPYVPLSFQRVTNVDSGQPAIICSTRYGLETTPLNPEAYARSFGVSFANTSIL